MKKLVLLLLVSTGVVWAQTAPSGYTTNYALRKWASGANPSADSLNANWDNIDTYIRTPNYTNQDSIRSTGNAIKLGNGDGTDAVTVPGTITLTGGIASVNSISSEGTTGVPVIVDVVATSAYELAVSATNISNSTASGVYRINVYLESEVAGSETVYLKLAWLENNGATVYDSTATITLSAETIYTYKTFVVGHTGGGATAMTYQIVKSAATDLYRFRIITERLY